MNNQSPESGRVIVHSAAGVCIVLFLSSPVLPAQSTDATTHFPHDFAYNTAYPDTHRLSRFIPAPWKIPMGPGYPRPVPGPDATVLIRVLDQYPELHDVVFMEYFRVSEPMNRRRYAGLDGYTPIPQLECDARWNMQKYGLPYDPMRPWTMRTSFNFQFLKWLREVLH